MRYPLPCFNLKLWDAPGHSKRFRRQVRAMQSGQDVPGRSPEGIRVLLKRRTWNRCGAARAAHIWETATVRRSAEPCHVALEALRDCWKQRRATMDELYEAARVCRVAKVMRPYLESVA